MNNIDGKTVVTCVELARLTGKGASTWRKAAAKGKVPAVKVGKTWLFELEKVKGHFV